MFGLSLSKIALTAAVIFAVWYGLKYLNRLTGLAKQSGKSGESDEVSLTVENLLQCAVCGTYVAATSAPSCDCEGCPHR